MVCQCDVHTTYTQESALIMKTIRLWFDGNIIAMCRSIVIYFSITQPQSNVSCMMLLCVSVMYIHDTLQDGR